MIPIDAAGFIEGCFFVPVNVADAQLRLVTESGDGATDAVLGHMTALAYLRGDPSSRCPDVPPCDGGCARVTEMMFYDNGVGEFGPTLADAIAWMDNVSSPFWDYGSYDFGTSVIFDDTKMWSSQPALRGRYGSGYPATGLEQIYLSFSFMDYMAGVDPVEFTAEDYTFQMIMEFAIGDVWQFEDGGPMSASDAGAGFSIFSSAEYNTMLYVRNDRLYLDSIDSGSATFPNPSTSIDLGRFEDSPLCVGEPVALTVRVSRPSTTERRIRMYLNTPCADPVLWEDQTFTIDASTPNDSYVQIFNYNYPENVASGDPYVWLWRFSMDTDSTVFGIPA
jgi:hypothetical protein